jgi:hypothetical protein
VLAEATEAYRAALGERLLAAYALGSLAHGGFSELVSDVDLGLLVSDPLQPEDAEMIQAIADTEKRKGSALHERLSVFCGAPSTLRGEQTGGRSPALDRLDLIENVRVLSGSDDVRRALPTPNGRELDVTGAEFALDCLAGARALFMTTRAQAGGIERDLDVLRTIARERDACLAVGALVVDPGTISTGDALGAG